MSPLRILRGVLRQAEVGSSFSLSSSAGEQGGDGSSSSILLSKSQIRLPMISTISSFSEDSLSFSRMRLKLSEYSMKISGLSSSSCLASRNSATWMGELNNFNWWVSFDSGLAQGYSDYSLSTGRWLAITNYLYEIRYVQSMIFKSIPPSSTPQTTKSPTIPSTLIYHNSIATVSVNAFLIFLLLSIGQLPLPWCLYE